MDTGRSGLTRINMKKTGRLINSYYFRYFWIFCITAFFVYLPFIVNGRSFVWHKDGYEQNFRALAYYSVWLRKLLLNFLHGDFSIPAWSFGLGYGSDIITTLHYYAIGEPLYLFSALIPREGLWGFYGFAEVLRLFLAGVFFFCLSKIRIPQVSTFRYRSFVRSPDICFLRLFICFYKASVFYLSAGILATDIFGRRKDPVKKGRMGLFNSCVLIGCQ